MQMGVASDNLPDWHTWTVKWGKGKIRFYLGGYLSQGVAAGVRRQTTHADHTPPASSLIFPFSRCTTRSANCAAD